MENTRQRTKEVLRNLNLWSDIGAGAWFWRLEFASDWIWVIWGLRLSWPWRSMLWYFWLTPRNVVGVDYIQPWKYNRKCPIRHWVTVAVSIVTRLRAGRPRNRGSFPTKESLFFFFSSAAKRALGSTRPPVQSVPVFLCPGYSDRSAKLTLTSIERRS
jgi:hypothetical protein